jgi:hypothetical protein
MGLKLLVVTRIGFILAVLGVFIIVVSYFAQYDYALGIAFFIVDISISPQTNIFVLAVYILRFCNRNSDAGCASGSA